MFSKKYYFQTGRVSSLVTILIFAQTGILNSHHEAAHWSCDSNTDTHVQAHFNPGRITLDGQVDDWKDIDGSAFSVLPALDPDADKAYNGGKMTVKVLVNSFWKKRFNFFFNFGFLLELPFCEIASKRLNFCLKYF